MPTEPSQLNPSVTALHEAAHCAAHKFLLGKAPWSATILGDADAATLGHVQPSRGWDDPETARAAVLALLAGLAAELHVGVGRSEADASADGDVEFARVILDFLGERDRFELHVDQARAFVATLLAADLDDYATLEWEEIDMRLDGCDDASMARTRAMLRGPGTDAPEARGPDPS